MTSVEIKRHESPYANEDNQFPVLAPPPCGGGCSCCCCCSSSSFVIPEGIILMSITRKNPYGRRQVFLKWMLIYGLGFILYGVVIALLYFVLPYLALGLSFFGVFGTLVANPIVVGLMSDKAKIHDSDNKARPVGLYVFLLGILGVGIYFLVFGWIAIELGI